MNKDDFNQHGFLSADTAETIAAVRMDFKLWFDLAEDVSRFAMRWLHNIVAPNIKTSQQFLVGTTLLRALQTYQATIILAERGIQTDARSLVRIVCETAIAAGAAATDGTFSKRLAADHYKHIKRAANALLADPVAGPALPPEQRQKVEAALADVKQRYGESGPVAINWEAEALKSDMQGLYLMVYRMTSGDSLHATASSLDHHVFANDAGDIMHLLFGPQYKGTDRTLSAAITSMLHALSVVPKLFPAPEPDMDSLVKRYHALMEPGGAN